MKKKISFLFIFLFVISLFACNKNVEETKPKYENEETYKIDYSYIDGREIELKYTDEYFYDSSDKINYHLADVSLVKSIFGTNLNDGDDYSNSYKEEEKFHKLLGFNNYYANNGYKNKPEEASIGVFVASKNIKVGNDDYTLISVSYRMLKYGLEWVSNAHIGEDGNHYGFNESADIALKDLKEYISKIKENNKNIKIWFSGYSRGGAISGLMAAKLMDENYISKNDIYTYTFESPMSLEKSKNSYNNIFNFYNSSDIVANFFPSNYNLVRPGIDIEITSSFDTSKFNELLSYYNPSTYENFKGRKQYLIPTFMRTFTEKLFSETYLPRKTYHNDYEEGISYLFKILFSKSIYQAVEVLSDAFSSFSSNYLEVLDEQKIYDALKASLDKYNYEYDSLELSNACHTVYLLATNVLIPSVGISNLTSLASNADFMTSFHRPEVTLSFFRSNNIFDL